MTAKAEGLTATGPAGTAILDGRVPVRTVAGLDTASDRLHMVCSNGFTASHTCRKKMEADDRRHELFSHARNMFELLPHGTLLVVEEPLALKNGKTTRLLGLAAGAIWAAHLDCAVFWAWADVAAWKKAVVGNGNADKAAIQAWVESQGFSYTEEDFFDAHCLMLYGQMALEKAHQ